MPKGAKSKSPSFGAIVKTGLIMCLSALGGAIQTEARPIHIVGGTPVRADDSLLFDLLRDNSSTEPVFVVPNNSSPYKTKFLNKDEYYKQYKTESLNERLQSGDYKPDYEIQRDMASRRNRAKTGHFPSDNPYNIDGSKYLSREPKNCISCRF